MAQKEKQIINQILKNLPVNQRLFRINAGTGWIGKIAGIIKDRDILMIQNPRPLRAAPEGWPDLCGWEEIEITPDMVGSKIARFFAVEVKASGKLSYRQKKFKEIIEKMGGRFSVVTAMKPLSVQQQGQD